MIVIPAPSALLQAAIKVQRETFTMISAESNKNDEIRMLAAAHKFFTTRSAVIRAGVMGLEWPSDE